jgi:cytochrome c-type biogenesis protein CcmH
VTMNDSRSLRLPALLSIGVALVVAGAALFLVSRASSGNPTFQDRARAVADGLRCPSCQDLAVADSPSRIAGQMRGEIARRLRAGQSEEEIRQFFVARYGQWILLSPGTGGLGFVAWVAPAVGLAGGIVVVWSLLRRRRRGEEALDARHEDAPTDAERARIARELAAMEEPG